MGKVIIVAGDTGTGKSTSIKTLDPKETFIINVLNKPLPFKGSSKIYSEENKNMKAEASWGKVKEGIEALAKKPEIKNIIIQVNKQTELLKKKAVVNKNIQVNSIDTLIGLCPNHHWEFDHGELLLEDIPKRSPV